MKKITRLVSTFLAVSLLLVGCNVTPEQPDSTTDPDVEVTDDAGDETEEPTDGDDDNTEAPDATEHGVYAIPEDVIPEETVTLEVYTQLANYSGEQIGWFGEVMLEKFNVKLNIINEGDGVFATRMVSGNLGDLVVFGDDTADYLQAIEAGLLFDWEEDNVLADYGPYILEHMPDALEKNKAISSEAGDTIYGFGHNVGTSADDYEPFFYRPDIRWDLYAELGYPEVNTMEDFIPLLQDMVELEPTSDTGAKTYGVSLFSDWDGDMVMFVKAMGALYGYDEFGVGLYNVDTQEYEGALEEGGMYLRALKFYNDLHQLGLLNPDSMTQTFTDMSEDFQTGAAFFNIFDYMGSGLYNTTEHLAEGKAMLPLAANDQKNLAYGLNIYGNNRVWTIGNNTDYPELVMAIINWLSTPEGTLVMNWGPKGVTWDYDENGDTYMTDFGLEVMADGTIDMIDGYTGTFEDGTSKINNLTWSLAAVNPDSASGETYTYTLWESFKSREVSEVEQGWRDHTGALDVNEYLANGDHLSISVGTTYSGGTKSNELTTIWNQVTETVRNGSWQAIYANSDAEYDAIVEQMREDAIAYGYEEVIAFQAELAVERAELENQAKADSGS